MERVLIYVRALAGPARKIQENEQNSPPHSSSCEVYDGGEKDAVH